MLLSLSKTVTAAAARRRKQRRLSWAWWRHGRRMTVALVTAAAASFMLAAHQVVRRELWTEGNNAITSPGEASSFTYWRVPAATASTPAELDPARSLRGVQDRPVRGDGRGDSARIRAVPASAEDDHQPRPPPSACYGSTQHALPYLSRRDGQRVARAWAERQPSLRQQLQLQRQRQQQQQQQQQGSIRPPVANSNAPVNKGELLRMLLAEAEAMGRLLLTVQIGGHDGKSNDPMYNALVRDTATATTGTVTSSKGNAQRLNRTLAHWLPVVVEPVGPNYGRLMETYQDIHRRRTLPCQVPVRWAMSYGNEASTGNGGLGGGTKTCPFYRFNNDASAPASCRDKPDWVKTQLGTISEANGRLRHALHWECIVVDHVPCGTLRDLLVHQWGSDAANAAMLNLMVLQVDVEGYEEVLLPAVMREADANKVRLPPIIHYESKIVKYWDRRDNTTRLPAIRDTLRRRGYEIYEDLEDDLAIHIDGP